MNWSRFQTDIYNAFEYSPDSLLIEAVAGSGKTTVLVELSRIMAQAFPEQRAVFVAFNKSIADELARRITARNVRAMTLHSAGWSVWRRAGGLDWEPRVDSHKVSGIMRDLLSYEENKRFGETTRKLVGYAKGIGLVPHRANGSGVETNYPVDAYKGLVDDTDIVWEGLIDHYGLDEAECNIPLVRKVLARSIELGREACDFDDMLYMPVIAGVPFDRYDVVLVDEAQDVSAIQRTMIERMAMGRVVACGDRKQSIFGFRGAGTNSMDELKQHFNMRELPLSVSYRCPQDVVSWAQQWVPQMEWADTADFGYVGMEGTDWARQCEIALEGISKWKGIADFRPGDAILCRLTRPVVAAAFALIRRKVACHVLGRDIGKGLVDLVRKAKSLQAGTVEAFGKWLDDYEYREAARLRDKGKHAQAGLLGDKADTIRVFMEQLALDDLVPRLIAEIERLFVDNGGGQQSLVVLSTIHKFKGMERDRVFILDAGLYMPCPWARGSGWEMQGERNLMYVAATRAKKELRYIKTSDLEGR
jgi:superfamily I DNA/RNA helicase